MPVQPPFRSDAFAVENADAPSADRLIEASTLDGSLRFTDARIPAGINLHQLAGLQRGQQIGAEHGEGYRQHLGHPHPHDNLLMSLLGQ